MKFVCRNNLFQGVTSTRFGPNDSMSRGMVVTVLGRMAEVDGDDYNVSSFPDVLPSAWYGPYVQWGYKNEIITGYGTGYFKPNDAMTRQDLCVVLARYATTYAKLVLPPSGDLPFKDKGQIASYAEDAVGALWAAGIVEGSNGNFNPKAHVTRAQAATILMRFMQKYGR